MASKIAAIYVRVSTGEQNVAMQLNDLRAYAKQRGLEIYREYQDQISGSVERRPALDELMDAARKKRFDGILVWRFDRFARSTRHLVQALAEFQALDIDFTSYSENIDTGSPIGEAIFTIIAAMSQLERDIIRERVRGGLRNAKSKGVRLGRPKIRNDDEIHALRSQGLSFREVAARARTSVGAVQRALAVSKCQKKPA